MEKKYSDLPFGPNDEKVILVQQGLSIGKRRGLFLANDSLLSETFKRGVNLRGLIHIGSIHCSNHENDPGKPIGLGPSCNGTITIKVVEGNSPPTTQVVCSNPLCGMNLLSRLTIPEISNIMFHLMIKQMIPDLETCNYLNCSALDAQEESSVFIMDDIKKIRAFGLISLSSNTLYGVVDNGYFSSHGKFSLGFTLMPGMNTMNGCDGFDKWLRFLIIKKFKWLKERHQASMADLLGPRPAHKN